MFYEVVTIHRTFYAPINPKDNRLYSKEELPYNAVIIKEKAPITYNNNDKSRINTRL